jgi:nucleoside triphosphate pyrophosphatase
VVIDGRRPLLLASASPRRRELLERAGIALRVRPVDVEEAVLAGERWEAYLERIVDMKSQAAVALPEARSAAATLVADTVVVHEGAILGKPVDDDEARAMIAALGGARHEVATRFALADEGGSRLHVETVITAVWFRPLDAAQVDRYVRTGEGRDKAGAYAIQGVGAMLVQRIEGSYSNVVGLPLCEVVLALERLGLVEPA